jgi:hypothetical protein
MVFFTVSKRKEPYSIIIDILLSFSVSFNVSVEQGRMVFISQWQILPVLQYPG